LRLFPGNVIIIWLLCAADKEPMGHILGESLDFLVMSAISHSTRGIVTSFGDPQPNCALENAGHARG
jgi:hypothetical protein